MLNILIGALLVCLGVLAGATADRIRGIKLTRERTRVLKQAPVDDLPGNPAQIAMSREVITALVTAGYSKPEAIEATCGCKPSETSTLESWTRAALKRCSA